MRPEGIEDQLGMILPMASPAPSGGQPTSPQPNSIAIALFRGERNFSDRDRLILNLLRPHLSQAYQNAQVATQMQQTLATLTGTLEALSTITLTADGTVEHITHSAQTLLSRYFQPVSLGDRLPEILHTWVKHRMTQLSQSGHPSSELPSPCLPLQIERMRDRLTIPDPGAPIRPMPAVIGRISLPGAVERDLGVAWIDQTRGRGIVWHHSRTGYCGDRDQSGNQRSHRQKTSGAHPRKDWRKNSVDSRAERADQAGTDEPNIVHGLFLSE